MSSPSAAEALRRLMTEAIAAHEVVAASLGLSPTDLHCFEIAASEPDMTPSRLAELSDLTSGAVTGVLDRLERAGFVRREPDPTDRRRLLVRIDPLRRVEVEERYGPIVALAIAAGVRAGVATPETAADLLSAVAGALRDDVHRLRVATQGGLLDDAYQFPRGDVARARLVLHTGAPRVSVGGAAFGQQVRMVAESAATRLELRAGRADGELIQASFVGPPPDVRTVDGTVTMRYRRRVLDPRSREIEAALNPEVAWRVEIDNGITDLGGDLRELELLGLDVRGGVNNFSLHLPRPRGTVRIAIGGGSSRGRFSRPAGVPVLLAAGGGVSRLALDDVRRDSSGTPLRVRSRGYDQAPDRYEIEIEGGISDLVIGEDRAASV